MNEKLPYEESLSQQLNDLPLPDQEQAWQKMELLLDEDDNDRVPPPIFLRGCLGWGILLSLLALLWFFFRPEKWLMHQEGSRARQIIRPSRTLPLNPASGGKTPHKTKKETGIYTPPSEHGLGREMNKGNKVQQAGHKGNDAATRNIKKDRLAARKATAGSREQKIRPAQQGLHQDSEIREGESNVKMVRKNIQKEKADTLGRRGKEPGRLQGKDTGIKKRTDTAIVVLKNDTLPNNKIVEVQIQVPQKKAGRKINFSAGLGLQQQVPLAGQKSTAYNYYGRKGSLADYVPFLFVGLHHKEQWYIQGGFRYGAPQMVKEVAYEQHTVTRMDSSAGGPLVSITTTTTARLKKTFYHQVPVSFNYFIKPHWSLGGGMMYSRFFGAISEQEEKKKNNATQVETVSKQILQVPANTDSFFTISQAHLLVQSEFIWRRLAFGLRYTRGLTPYIWFNTPSGELKGLRNQSLDVFVRLRIWQSK